MYLALGIIYLIFSLLMAAGIIFTLVKSSKNGGDLISKKNLLYVAPTFLIIYLLHITAAAYNGAEIEFFYCFGLINTVLEVLKFKVQIAIISPICKAYPIFYVDFVLAFVVGGATVILSVTSFFSSRISNAIRVKRSLYKNCDIVVGDSPDAVRYIKNTKNSVLLGTNITSQRYADLLKQGVPVLKIELDTNSISCKLKAGRYNVIVFRDTKYSYTKIMKTFAMLGNKVKVHVEANQQEMKILKEKFIMKADKNSNLHVTGFNKYELMARRFVVDYPVTKYVPRSFYNENCTLKNDKQINVVFIGFGKVNYQLFRTCAMQFQFAEQNGDKLAVKPVKYHIYDNEKTALNNEFCSRILFEFDEEFKNCDFPKPEKICDVNIRTVDINSVEAKKEFKTFVNDDSFTYFIVSLDSDLEDASYAQTVKRLFGECENYRIFVRAKNVNGEQLNEMNDRIIYFGEEKNLYTHENIVNDDLTELAQRINLLYNNISNPPAWLKELKSAKDLTADEQRKILNENLARPENKEYMLEKWDSLPYIERASNLYHALNLPFKLNLLGFDMVKGADGGSGIAEEQFNEYYKNSGRESGYDDYSFFFKTESSNVLAFIEHSRWNALYIIYDYKQMKKADMHVSEECGKNGNVVKVMAHKDTAKKQHACLTTYYGLNELIKYKYETLYSGETLNEKNYKTDTRLQELGKIYAYDYMDLDRLYSEITAMGYKLVSNHNENK